VQTGIAIDFTLYAEQYVRGHTVRLFPTPALSGSGSTGMISGIALWDYPQNDQPPRFNVLKFIQQKLNTVNITERKGAVNTPKYFIKKFIFSKANSMLAPI